MKNPLRAALWLGLIAVGFVWQPAWAILAVVVLADWAERHWQQLLDAIRTRRQGLSEIEEGKYESSQESDHQIETVLERQVEIAHQESQYKHIPGLPWGDPSSYAKALTAEELEQARKGLQKREAERYKREAQAVIDRERKRLDDEKREQEAREYLIRESERVQKEREEREARRKPQEPEPEPITSAPLIIVKPPSQEAEAELCKCGYPGCLGHEVIKGQIIFPGFTSEAAMAQSPHELVCLNVEVTGVAGNPSDGRLPASAIRTRRGPRG